MSSTYAVTSVLTTSPPAEGRESRMPWQITPSSECRSTWGRTACPSRVPQGARVRAELDVRRVRDGVELVDRGADLDGVTCAQEHLGGHLADVAVPAQRLVVVQLGRTGGAYRPCTHVVGSHDRWGDGSDRADRAELDPRLLQRSQECDTP